LVELHDTVCGLDQRLTRLALEIRRTLHEASFKFCEHARFARVWSARAVDPAPASHDVA
jgi:hypothetical protein